VPRVGQTVGQSPAARSANTPYPIVYFTKYYGAVGWLTAILPEKSATLTQKMMKHTKAAGPAMKLTNGITQQQPAMQPTKPMVLVDDGSPARLRCLNSAIGISTH